MVSQTTLKKRGGDKIGSKRKTPSEWKDVFPDPTKGAERSKKRRKNVQAVERRLRFQTTVVTPGRGAGNRATVHKNEPAP